MTATNPINEGMIDRRIADAVRYHDKSDASLKLAAFAAYFVVGRYDGATQEIARQTRRSVSTVENWAHAAKLYRLLRLEPFNKVARVRELWRKLPISFWWSAYDEIHRREWDALEYLNLAYIHELSVRDMLAEFRADWEREHGAPPPVPFAKKKARFFQAFSDLLTDYDLLKQSLTAAELEAVRVLKNAFERLMEAK